MSCISLSNTNISKLLSSKLTSSDIQYYKTNKREFKSMWNKLKNEFWIKFILKCKEILGKSYYYKKCNELDVSFVEILDVLVCVDYNSVFSLIEHYGKILSEFTFVDEKEEAKMISRMDVLAIEYIKKKNIFQTIAAFIRLLPKWQKSNADSFVDWIFPVYWGYENVEDHLEMYIKSKWSKNELEIIFDCSIQQIPWLRTAKSSNDIHELFAEVKSLEIKRIVSKGSNPPESIKAVFGWIPVVKISKRTPRFVTECGNQELLRQSNSNELRIWELIENSLPPILHKRYHTNNLMDLIENETSCHFMGVCTIFSIWDTSFGLQLLVNINDKSEVLDLLCISDSKIANGEWKYSKSNKKVKEWRDRVDEVLAGIDRARRLVDKPTTNDIAKSSLEFLLEITIIVQLPWNCVLLHQWLVSSLMEVLIFEHKSLELRHWPMPKNVIGIATELLNIVKNLKERIVLGFAIMSRQIVLHEEIYRKYPEILMNEVIIPSLPILQFLITGKAFQILKNIKLISWGKNKKVDNTNYISEKSYMIDSKLQEFYSRLCYNFIYWENLVLTQPFPGTQLTENDIKNIIIRINSKKSIPINNNGSFKLYSQEEHVLLKIVKINREAVTNTERIQLVVKTITENIINQERININIIEIIQFVNTKEMTKLSGIIFNKPENSIENHIILSSMIYNELYGMLLGSEKENSILSNIVNKQMEILEREQIIRLTNLLSIKFNINPIAIGISSQEIMTIETMSSYVNEVNKRQKLQNYEWLLLQFPEKWRKEISKTSILFGSPVNGSQKIFNEACTERIGRIIFHVAKNAFKVYEKTGVYFKYLQFAQYVVPCYLASFLFSMNTPRDDEFKNEIFESFQNFITEILLKLEEKYELWYNGYVTSVVDMKIFERQNLVTGLIGELLTLGEYYRNTTHNILKLNLAERGPDDEEEIGMFGLANIHLGLQEWTNALIAQVHQGEDYKEIVPFVITWSISAFEFFKFMYDISFYNTWPVPNIPQLKNTQLSDMFMSDLVMQAMELVFQIMKSYKTDEDCVTGSTIMLHLKVYAMKTKWADDHKLWRYKILKSIQEDRKNFNFRDADYYNETIEFFVDFYNALKTFRSTNEFPKKIHLFHLFPEDPPQIKIAAQLYLQGNIQQLDTMLPLLPQNQRKKQPKNTNPVQKTNQQAEKFVEQPKKQPEWAQKQPEWLQKQPELHLKQSEWAQKPPEQPQRTQKQHEQPETSKKQSENPQKQPEQSQKQQKKKKVKKQCKKCGKYESKRSSFVVCQKCINDNYPDINYFCGTRCRDIWWKEEHMAEHLEFELGLGEFAYVNSNK